MSQFPADDTRTRELILHIAARGADWKAFATPLMHRILFQADFLHFRLYGFPITGQTYLRGVRTPFPRPKSRILRDMQAAGDLEIREEPDGDGLYARSVPRALREPDLRIFDGQEIALVERVLRHFREGAADAGSDTGELPGIPWEYAGIREEIPYALGLLERISPGFRGAGPIRRVVIPSTGLTEALSLWGDRAFRAEEFLEGATWLLERNAEIGRRDREDAGILFLEMAGWNKHPPLRLSYSIYGRKVLLLALSEANPGRIAPIFPTLPFGAAYEASKARANAAALARNTE